MHINSPCCVDMLLAVLTVIDGVVVIFVFPSVAFVSFESCRDNENRREFIPKFATPLVTLATSELKKLIFMVIFSLAITIINDISHEFLITLINQSFIMISLHKCDIPTIIIVTITFQAFIFLPSDFYNENSVKTNKEVIN